MQIVWFKRDLRVEDHRPLAYAAARGPVLPLYVIEPELWQQPTMSGRQWAFVAECLNDLQSALAKLGQPLLVRRGDVVEVLTELRSRWSLDVLWSHQETGDAWTFERDNRVGAWCRLNGVEWRQERQHGVIRVLNNRDGWARRWDQFMAEPLAAAPALEPSLAVTPSRLPNAAGLMLAPDPCPERQAGGRNEALTTLSSFLDRRGETYQRAMSSPLAGAQACSRLSPHLAWGTVSMREVTQSLKVRMAELKRSPQGGFGASMRSFHGRLHWHCHFIQKLEDEPRLEFENLHKAYDGLRPKPGNEAHLRAFERGETGWPFVDACMRSLRATGWLNFRMRAMLMAVASYHLWLDWRRPGEHLARLFTDYEAGIHWPQVQMQSGTTGMNTVRIYNPVKQGKDQDPDGAFVRRWLPELGHVPDRVVHEPWLWGAAGTILGKAYPEPVTDHLEAAKRARSAVWGTRRGQPFQIEASALQARHGSRRSGIPFRGRKKVKPAKQLSWLEDDGV